MTEMCGKCRERIGPKDNMEALLDGHCARAIEYGLCPRFSVSMNDLIRSFNASHGI